MAETAAEKARGGCENSRAVLTVIVLSALGTTSRPQVSNPNDLQEQADKYGKAKAGLPPLTMDAPCKRTSTWRVACDMPGANCWWVPLSADVTIAGVHRERDIDKRYDGWPRVYRRLNRRRSSSMAILLRFLRRDF